MFSGFHGYATLLHGVLLIKPVSTKNFVRNKVQKQTFFYFVNTLQESMEFLDIFL
jgi:hypothetical protein